MDDESMQAVSYFCKPCNVLSFHMLDQKPLFCVSCLKCDDGTTALLLDAAKPPDAIDLLNGYFACAVCSKITWLPNGTEPRRCSACGWTGGDLPTPVGLDVPVIDSPAIRRIIEEVRSGDTEVGRVFNRTYNRHNR